MPVPVLSEQLVPWDSKMGRRDRLVQPCFTDCHHIWHPGHDTIDQLIKVTAQATDIEVDNTEPLKLVFPIYQGGWSEQTKMERKHCFQVDLGSTRCHQKGPKGPAPILRPNLLSNDTLSVAGRTSEQVEGGKLWPTRDHDQGPQQAGLHEWRRQSITLVKGIIGDTISIAGRPSKTEADRSS